MLRIEINMFSGRPKPVWIVTDPGATKELLGAVGSTKGAATKQGAGFTGLGFREVRVDILGDDEPRTRAVPQHFSLASTAAKDLEASGELARRLIEAMPVRGEVKLLEHAITPLTKELRNTALERLDRYLRNPNRPRHRKPRPVPPNPLRTTIVDEKCTKCQYEVSQFNPGFWNTSSVQP